jgi:hypothetical protein
MTVEPRVTWPSAAMTTESPRRTQRTVVERTRRATPFSSGPRSSGCPVAWFGFLFGTTRVYRCGVPSSFELVGMRRPWHDILIFIAVKPRILQTAQYAAQQVQGQVRSHPRMSAGIAGGVAVSVVAAWLIGRARRPKPEEIERRRREYLTKIGRLTDGYLTDARDAEGEDTSSATPDVLFYSYQLGGVRYNCAQDVARLDESIRGYRIDQPVQIRYDVRNPGNSIIVSETWNGLRFAGTRVLTDPVTLKIDLEEHNASETEAL